VTGSGSTGDLELLVGLEDWGRKEAVVIGGQLGDGSNLLALMIGQICCGGVSGVLQKRSSAASSQRARVTADDRVMSMTEKRPSRAWGCA
jgi:hypothetical protein